MAKKLGMGTVYPRGRKWWIESYFRGRLIRESSHSTMREDAERFLKKRMGEIASGQFRGLAPERVRVEDLLNDLVQDYALHERKSAPQLRSRLKHLRHFAHIRAADLSTQHIHRYLDERQRRAACNTTINRELQVLKRALALALECDPPKIARAPHIRLLPENNVRTGFLDDKQYIKLRDELPDYLKPIFVVAYHLGNRLGELRALRWEQVDLERKEIRLNPTQTKNKKGRVLPIYGEMLQWLLMHKTIRDTKYPHCRWYSTMTGVQSSISARPGMRPPSAQVSMESSFMISVAQLFGTCATRASRRMPPWQSRATRLGQSSSGTTLSRIATSSKRPKSWSAASRKV